MTVSFDLEWTRQGISTLGLAWGDGHFAAATNRDSLTLHNFLEVLRRADRIAGHNILDADIPMLAREGVDVSDLYKKSFDTRLAYYATAAHLAGTGSYDLRSVALLNNSRQGQRFPLDWKEYASDINKTCAMDACAVSWIVPTLDRVIKNNKLEATVDILHKVAPIFQQMQVQGVKLDRGILEAIHKDRKQRTEACIERYHLWEERGKKKIKRVPIWRSNKILDICEQQFGFRPKDRQRKTWEKLLNKPMSAEAKEFVEAIVDLGKGQNDAHWLGQATETDDGIDFSKVSDSGFIHPRYDICGSPDRAIASGPNIQNFPRPSDDPRDVKLRSAIVPLHPDHVLLGADYSSLETITNALESNDTKRAIAVLEKRLTHEGVAALINNTFGLTLSRNQGKAVGHGLDKGESPYNLARTLFKTERPSRQQVTQCQEIMMRMLSEFPEMSKFRNALWERAQANPLVVTNRFGRRLMCFSRSKYGDSGNSFAKHQADKRYWCPCSVCSPRRDRFKYAVAFLGRSSGFDALLRVMSKVWYEKRLDSFSLPMIECHDELVYSIPKDRVGHYAKILKETMEEPFQELNDFSLPSNVTWGTSWAEAH